MKSLYSIAGAIAFFFLSFFLIAFASWAITGEFSTANGSPEFYVVLFIVTLIMVFIGAAAGEELYLDHNPEKKTEYEKQKAKDLRLYKQSFRDRT